MVLMINYRSISTSPLAVSPKIADNLCFLPMHIFESNVLFSNIILFDGFEWTKNILERKKSGSKIRVQDEIPLEPLADNMNWHFCARLISSRIQGLESAFSLVIHGTSTLSGEVELRFLPIRWRTNLTTLFRTDCAFNQLVLLHIYTTFWCY